MNEDFAAIILTHGRPDKVHTHRTLRRSGYTGPIYLVVDDEDPTLPLYRERYGDAVITFSKREVAGTFDEGDNFPGRRGVIYARNACFEIARGLGLRRFVELDDDYTAFSYRAGPAQEYGTWNVESLDEVFALLVEYFDSIPAASLCLCQGGDFIGGADNGYVRDVTFKRKAMNAYICGVDRPFEFVGRVNEDTNTYVEAGRRGVLFITLMGLQIVQINTQQSSGGMTEIYLDTGTYTKSFYSVMYAPSCVSITSMGEVNQRIHHRVEWKNAVPVILREGHRKAG
jgi:hypothetical protein